MSQFLFALPVLFLSAALTAAGEFNKTLSVGDAAPAWADLDGTDGKKHALADLKDKDVVVVVFTCNSCPVAVDYEDRIIAFAKKHAAADAKVAVVAINVNTAKEDQLPEMKKRAEKKKLPYRYLYDPSQAIAKKYGAKYTPEFFVLNKERKVVYMGALDDKSNAADAKVNYLEAAVTAALAGKTVEKGETLARGCMIRYNREPK
jgi:peroxiredoxin